MAFHDMISDDDMRFHDDTISDNNMAFHDINSDDMRFHDDMISDNDMHGGTTWRFHDMMTGNLTTIWQYGVFEHYLI